MINDYQVICQLQIAGLVKENKAAIKAAVKGYKYEKQFSKRVACNGLLKKNGLKVVCVSGSYRLKFGDITVARFRPNDRKRILSEWCWW